MSTTFTIPTAVCPSCGWRTDSPARTGGVCGACLTQTCGPCKDTHEPEIVVTVVPVEIRNADGALVRTVEGRTETPTGDFLVPTLVEETDESKKITVTVADEDEVREMVRQALEGDYPPGSEHLRPTKVQSEVLLGKLLAEREAALKRFGVS